MSLLLEPARISSLSLRNRVVRSATAECLFDDDNRITDGYLDLYRRLARGKIGLIISGNLYVHPRGCVLPRSPVIDRDEIVDDLRRVTRLVHEHGGTIVAQLNHGGRQCSAALLGEQPLAPSAVKDRLTRTKPRAMTHEEILEAVEAFAAAARRVMDAGFDGVQLHAAHGYLINQFLSAHTNRREDEWGGDLDGRARFLFEVYRAVRAAIGDDSPLLVKINADDCVKGGVTVDECAATCARLEREGLDGVEISGGIYESLMMTTRGEVPKDVLMRGQGAWMRLLIRMFLGRLRRAARFEQGYYLPAAAKVKEQLSIPVIAVGGLRSPAFMEQLLQEGKADFVAMSRPFIRNPNLVKAMLKGKEDPVTCNNCNRCSLEVAQHGNPLKCYLGREAGA